ncbi:MAG: hypothetical protein QG583_810 [Patescibacteria group bacterium]|nr:hypothetical protein [Patescibacteria group bacterium]MDQ5971375.1 hypothetical protein [Patescibacteria group bacterium]
MKNYFLQTRTLMHECAGKLKSPERKRGAF